MFGFLWRLHEMDNNAIRQRSDELVSPYSGDLNLSIKDEYLQLRHYIAQSERHVSDPNPTTLCIEPGPALALGELGGRPGPPILGGRQIVE